MSSLLVSYRAKHVQNNNYWKKYYERIISKWNKLRMKANKFRLGIVISWTDTGSLTNPEKFPLSIPLLQLLEDMGFSLDILIYYPCRVDKKCKKSILEILDNVDKHRVDFCSNYEQIREWLESSDSDCVYSDFVSDKRLQSSGKTRFSLPMFERGYEGAIRSLERLVKRCEIGFYKDYKPYSECAARPISMEAGK